MGRTASLSGFSLALLLASAACNKQVPPAAEEARSAAPASPTAVAAPVADAPVLAPATADSGTAAAAPAASHYTEAGFDLVMQPKGDYAAGKSGEAEIILNAKAPFHVNDKYPYKFKLKDAAGLKFANAIVTRDLVKLEPARATVPVAFTPETAGKHTLAGVLSFSVCTDDKCMIEKRDLALEIDAR